MSISVKKAAENFQLQVDLIKLVTMKSLRKKLLKKDTSMLKEEKVFISQCSCTIED